MTNRRDVKRKVGLAAAFALTAVSAGYYAHAVGPATTGFGYSGQLKDSGSPVSGTRDFVFDLVDGSGSTVGCLSDTRNGVAVTNGRFDVGSLFGSCASLDSILAAQPTLAVRITVDGQLLSPDQPLGSVPLALVAKNAGAVASTSDPYFANVPLLLHLRDTTDVKAHSVTNTNATFEWPVRNSPKVAGFASNAYLAVGASSDFALGTGDFTVELWVNTTTSGPDTVYRRIFQLDGPSGNSAANLQLLVDVPTGAAMAYDGFSGLSLIGTTNMTGQPNWHHVAMTRASGTLRLFLDGVIQGSATYTANLSPNGGSPRPWLGAYTPSQGRYNGKLSDLRITKGVARYTANFTPPETFPDQ